jgi:hypothetical protein
MAAALIENTETRLARPPLATRLFDDPWGGHVVRQAAINILAGLFVAAEVLELGASQVGSWLRNPTSCDEAIVILRSLGEDSCANQIERFLGVRQDVSDDPIIALSHQVITSIEVVLDNSKQLL